MPLKTGQLAVTVACGDSNYWHAHLTAADTARLVQLLKDRSGMTWETLAIELGYGGLAGKDLMACARSGRRLGPDSTVKFARSGAKHGWLSPEESESFIGAIRCAQVLIEANKADMALTKRLVSATTQALTKELGLSDVPAAQLAKQHTRQLLLDAKMVLCDELIWFDRLAYQDPDECVAAEPTARSLSSTRLPSL